MAIFISSLKDYASKLQSVLHLSEPEIRQKAISISEPTLPEKSERTIQGILNWRNPAASASTPVEEADEPASMELIKPITQYTYVEPEISAVSIDLSQWEGKGYRYVEPEIAYTAVPKKVETLAVKPESRNALQLLEASIRSKLDEFANNKTPDLETEIQRLLNQRKALKLQDEITKSTALFQQSLAKAEKEGMNEAEQRSMQELFDKINGLKSDLKILKI